MEILIGHLLQAINRLNPETHVNYLNNMQATTLHYRPAFSSFMSSDTMNLPRETRQTWSALKIDWKTAQQNFVDSVGLGRASSASVPFLEAQAQFQTALKPILIACLHDSMTLAGTPPEPLAILIAGSWARGEYLLASDLDLIGLTPAEEKSTGVSPTMKAYWSRFCDVLRYCVGYWVGIRLDGHIPCVSVDDLKTQLADTDRMNKRHEAYQCTYLTGSDENRCTKLSCRVFGLSYSISRQSRRETIGTGFHEDRLHWIW